MLLQLSFRWKSSATNSADEQLLTGSSSSSVVDKPMPIELAISPKLAVARFAYGLVVSRTMFYQSRWELESTFAAITDVHEILAICMFSSAVCIQICTALEDRITFVADSMTWFVGADELRCGSTIHTGTEQRV